MRSYSMRKLLYWTSKIIAMINKTKKVDQMFSKDIISGRMCPYCFKQSMLVNGSAIYWAKYSHIRLYLCRDCRAYVWVHEGTTKALWRLANPELRIAKQEAHLAFDRLWKGKWWVARRDAYSWLSKVLNIPLEYTHIGMFDEVLCRRTVQVVKTRLSEIPKAKWNWKPK